MFAGNTLFAPESRKLLSVLAEQIAPETEAVSAPEDDQPNRLLALVRTLRPAGKAQPVSPRATAETPVCG
jgi:hypothetical protein